ncbi:uncharacterized protein LOC127720504 isoform X2 [Mytilus californianus]|uniref:uncharacterized protein LOC127720504 isoform X2 n=1 Tax=Mytilus californianus TaxID=6549 RepID=UPI002248203B|nr:uncharacterized protein LOC127720504 isoform X2 [Mytilus californianus]
MKKISDNLETVIARQSQLADKTDMDRLVKVIKEIGNDITPEKATSYLDENPDFLDGYISNNVSDVKILDLCRRKGINISKLDLNSTKLGQKLFVLEKQVILKYEDVIEEPTGGVFMNDGTLVLVSFIEKKLVVFDSKFDHNITTHLKGKPWHVVAIDHKKVAVTLHKDANSETENSIHIYDVDNKNEIVSIVLTEGPCYCIAKLNEYLLVTVDEFGLVFVNTETCKIKPHKIEVSKLGVLCATENRLFLTNKNKLFCCKISKNSKNYMKFSKRRIPGEPSKATMLPNGTMYITCTNGILQHVAVEGKHKAVHGCLDDLVNPSIINFSSYQGLLYVAGGEGLVNVYRKLF